MAVRIADFEREVQRKRGEYDLIKRNLDSYKTNVASYKNLLESILEAQKVIQAVAIATQSKVVFRINDIVNKVINQAEDSRCESVSPTEEKSTFLKLLSLCVFRGIFYLLDSYRQENL